MNMKHLVSITLIVWLAGCASTQNVENARKTQQSIDTALQQAGEVNILQAEAPADDILDELLPGSGVNVPGLADDIARESSFDISVANAPARLFFMSLVKDTDINMVVHPSVEGELSLDLKNVTVGEVMSLTREVYGYEYRKSAHGYIVLPARIQSRIFPVNYLNIARAGKSSMTVSSGQLADSGSSSSSDDDDSSSSSNSSTAQSSSISTTIQADFWSDLQQTISAIVGGGEGRSVVVDRHAGLVIVRAMPGELRDVSAYLNNAQDSLQRQVILETKIIEVKLSDSFQSGIDWAALSSSREVLLGNTGFIDGSSQLFDDDAVASTASALSSSNTDFANLFTIGGATDDFGVLIRLLSTQGEVQVLSSPRVSTINNQKAIIKVGSDEFFVTDVSSSTSASSSSTTTTPDITLTPFFSGIALDVTPQISENEEVILHIHPSVSEITDQTKNITVGGQTQSLPLAFSTVRESDSVVKARNGQVVVIGGLMQNSTGEDDAGLPGVQDVPILGNLFKQKRKLNTRSELVILLRPIVVNSSKTWSNYIKDSAQRIENLRYDTAEGE
ncbi:MAG: pilus (MSHA type) biogenesis protein MshL [Gammaproteobacteria bacterium]|nr:pilus (MSHA type) biogenesis protein MshL [Gammaproteobacteria bacterium]